VGSNASPPASAVVVLADRDAAYHRPMISRSDVEHVARLARLGLTDAEIDRMVGELSRILEAVGKLREVDTSSVGPTAQVIALENVMREDVARPSMRREAALAEAPRREEGLLRVPVVLEEGR
jgi:aspartyl-tRNA(Asn)/glutamyl-tRNA(Gln) amidotransferase subunit C